MNYSFKNLSQWRIWTLATFQSDGVSLNLTGACCVVSALLRWWPLHLTFAWFTCVEWRTARGPDEPLERLSSIHCTFCGDEFQTHCFCTFYLNSILCIITKYDLVYYKMWNIQAVSVLLHGINNKINWKKLQAVLHVWGCGQARFFFINNRYIECMREAVK